MEIDEIFPRIFYISMAKEAGMKKIRFCLIFGSILLCVIWVQTAVLIPQTVTDQPGNSMLPQKGECVISEFSLTPVEGNNPHLSLLIKCQNKSSRLLKNLRLTLVKNHFSVNEWSPIGLGPGAASQVRYQDTMPLPGKTHHYIAILSWGDPVSQPQSVLDRKENQYRRGGVVIGHL
jgi:hypothetical protein